MAVATPQQFCVRWNSYQSNLQNAFPKLLTSEHFVDVTLACENEMLKCHKVVLSACSNYFEKLLLQNPCQHPIIFMKDMKFHEVQSLVDFMYKGEVNVTQDDLPSLLKSAEALQIRGLCGSDQLLNHQNFVKTQLAKATAAVAAAQSNLTTTSTSDPLKPNSSKLPETTIKCEKMDDTETTGNQSSSESDSNDGLQIREEFEIVKEEPDGQDSYFEAETEMLDTEFVEGEDPINTGTDDKNQSFAAIANVSCHYDGTPDLVITPTALKVPVKDVEATMLPERSKKLYELAYKKFLNYCNERGIEDYTETALVTYFTELSQNMKSSTLWSTYSMLKNTLNSHNGVDLGKYVKLRAFLKSFSSGYSAKKSRIFSMEQMRTFLLHAPDDRYLSTKIALIFGIQGGCKCEELLHLKAEDIEDFGNKLLVTLPGTKGKSVRSFIVSEHMDLYRKYSNSRPPEYKSERFFFKYSNGKAFKQCLGVHKFGKMPEEIATFLQLPCPNEYTGHCFRRTSSVLSSGSGVTIFKSPGCL